MEHCPAESRHSVPPLLLVPPIRIVAPPGVQPVLPPTFNPLNPFDGFFSSSNGFSSDPSRGRAGVGSVNAAPGCTVVPDLSEKNKKRKKENVSDDGCDNQGTPSVPDPSPSQSSTIPSTSSRKKSKRPQSSERPARRGSAPPSSSPKIAVVEALRLYDAVRRNLLLEDEFKGKEAAKGSRPDLNAGNALNSSMRSVNRGAKVVGHVPGVDIGNMFFYRMEISCVGLHGPIQGGIEYLTSKESPHNVPVAISIISSGGYDARDEGDELIYTGQGGKSGQDNKPSEDQKLERGNLALEGSMKCTIPVRVTRGIKDLASPTGKTYMYDGLYTVQESWSEKGKFGFEEFKFRLQRIPGQPELGSAVIKLSNELKYKPNLRQGVQVADLSQGKEDPPICVVNSVDDEIRPPFFEYVTTAQQSCLSSSMFVKNQGCRCNGVCELSSACSCFVRNQNSCAYLSNGTLVKERGVVYECGSNCICSFTCRNRATQRPSKIRFDVFKTEDRGWGLRSWDVIPAGSFICEYSGRFVDDMEALQTRDYVLNLGLIPEKDCQWGDVSRYVGKLLCRATSDIPRPKLIVDASEVGNMARFVNHSCFPNLLVQSVVRDQFHGSEPHLMLFAMDNIPPLKELTIDYGFMAASPNVEPQGKTCLCKSECCRMIFGC